MVAFVSLAHGAQPAHACVGQGIGAGLMMVFFSFAGVVLVVGTVIAGLLGSSDAPEREARVDTLVRPPRGCCAMCDERVGQSGLSCPTCDVEYHKQCYPREKGCVVC